MKGYSAATYGESIADAYDELTADEQTIYGQSWAEETRDSVRTLTALANGGRVLELGIGTGRVALPLRGAGLSVEGIDISPEMVDRMRSKPGGADIPVTLGDLADVGRDGPFSMAYVVYGTFCALTTQEDQLRCFRNVAARLTPDGVFVIETFVPDVPVFERGQLLETMSVKAEELTLNATVHDPVTQIVDAVHVTIGRAGNVFRPVKLRYVWPSELDLMARVAGMRLAGRYGGWNQEPFTAASVRHVSLYRLDR
jgi:SAM-dependent methyltransferase